ncbi:zinc finger protein 765-like isoform X2 [Ischnura elegans]|uniref:zinc finger protein 765-like isoform X2 n=1 Tax=Ischnura elegans TaxID=197161 RepID=UPI001ED8BC68|nr:zinc finger protein 765-like isoform X2 [Ischnura elegans]
METGQFCRLCLFSGRGLQDIFDSFIEDGTAVIDLIQDLLHLTVIQLKVFPWMICQSCMYHLQEFHCFKARCMRSKLVADGMFSVSMDGAITAQSLGFKRKEVDGLKCKKVGKNRTGKENTKNSMATKFDSTAKEQFGIGLLGTSFSNPVLSSFLEESEEDRTHTVVEFCRCQECGNEFLSHKELKAHSLWCRGVETFVPDSVDDNFEEEEVVTINSKSSMKQLLFDPNKCCGSCRRVFKTKERLIRHINKHNFKCKSKSIQVSVDFPETIDRENETKLLCSENNPCGIEGKNKSCEVYEEMQDLDCGLMKQHEETSGEREFVRGNEKQRAKGIEVAAWNDDKVKNIMQHHKFVCSYIEENAISKIQDPSLSHDLSEKTIDGNSNVGFLAHGMIQESEYLSNNRSEKKFNRLKTEGVYVNTVSRLFGLQENEANGGLNSPTTVGWSNANHCTKDVQLKRSCNLMEEMLSCSVNAVYICNYCDKPYSTKPDLRNHIVKCHLCLNPQKCHVCHRLFTNDEELEEHIRLHPKNKKFYCTVCEECFASRVDLRKHIVGMHGVKTPFICNLCYNGFTSKNDHGLHHSLVHTDFDKPFKCSNCNRCYTDRNYFNNHVKVCQLKAVLFKCNICGKSQTSATNLANHTLVHSKKKRFACPLCTKLFLLSGHRNSHIRNAHLKIKPFECGICNKRFSVKNHLNRHYIIHSDEKPFNCPKCPKSFKAQDYLKLHLLRIHSLTSSNTHLL